MVPEEPRQPVEEGPCHTICTESCRERRNLPLLLLSLKALAALFPSAGKRVAVDVFGYDWDWRRSVQVRLVVRACPQCTAARPENSSSPSLSACSRMSSE